MVQAAILRSGDILQWLFESFLQALSERLYLQSPLYISRITPLFFFLEASDLSKSEFDVLGLKAKANHRSDLGKKHAYLKNRKRWNHEFVKRN
jgi:hypothetical protein